MSENQNHDSVQIIKTDDQKYGVTLPFTDDQFKTFLKGLLGQPQTIEQKIRPTFVLEKQNLEHLNLLIHERIHQQNGGYLISFNAKLALKDGVATTFNSIDHLLSHNELRQSEPVWLSVMWTYLITFHDKDAPEKQTIEIVFHTGGRTGNQHSSYEEEAPFIQLRISHTARTFGLDMLAMLEPELKKLRVAFTPIRRKLRNFPGYIFLFSLAGITGISTWIGIRYARFVRKDYYNELALDPAKLNDPVQEIIAKLDLLWARLENSPPGGGIIILSVIVGIILSILIGNKLASMASPDWRSFICFTEQAIDQKKIQDTKIAKMPFRAGLTVFGTVTLGLIVEYMSRSFWG